MAARGARVALCVVAFAVTLGPIFSKPTFGSPGSSWWCNMFCDDDDVATTSTSTSLEDLLDIFFDPCGDCPPTRRPPTAPATPNAQPNSNGAPVNIMIPPSAVGVNLTMSNVGGSWLMNFVPWPFGGAASKPAAAAPAATTRAPPTTAAAAGNKTTAAGATTKKK